MNSMKGRRLALRDQRFQAPRLIDTHIPLTCANKNGTLPENKVKEQSVFPRLTQRRNITQTVTLWVTSCREP